MSTHVLILGGGFGGLEAATSLRKRLDPSDQVTLIDQNDFFYIGFSKYELMFGRAAPESIKAYYKTLEKRGIRFVQDSIIEIDPANKTVETRSGSPRPIWFNQAKSRY